MKNQTIRTLVLATLISALAFLFSCDSNMNAQPAENAVPTLQEIQAQIEAMPAEELNDEEMAGIQFMSEEEKLARDVYRVMYDAWGMRIFNNITQSEQTHMDALLILIEKYNLEDPVVNDSTGAFTNSDLQELYDGLMAQGSQSLIEGLKVGAAIEEIDILDLQREIEANTGNEDIVFVYENLMKGSRNHLRGFVRNLSRQGVTYAPQFLSEEAYLTIINSDWETGWK